MQSFFHTLDSLVAGLIALDNFRAAALQSLLNRAANPKSSSMEETK